MISRARREHVTAHSGDKVRRGGPLQTAENGLLLLALCTINLWGQSTIAGPATAGSAARPNAAGGQAAVHVKVPTVWLGARPTGFDQTMVSVSEHRFFLVIRNMTGIAELAYHIVQTSGPKMKDFSIRSDNPQYAAFMDVQPGTYEITEATHPAWTCQLIVK